MKLKPKKLVLVLSDAELASRSKVCRECGSDKPLTEFHKFYGGTARSSDGFRTVCKQCRRMIEAERQRYKRKTK